MHRYRSGETTIASTRTFDCVAYGVYMRLSADSDVIFAELPKLLPYATRILVQASAEAHPFSLLTSAEGRGFRCFDASQVLFESADMVAVMEALASALMVHVANYASDRVFVHAGVVGFKHQAIVLPGRSFAGKSTLTAALIRAGATYYSDEYAVLDAEGFVHPYARDLSMRQQGEAQQQSTPVGQFGGIAGTDRLPVALVLFTQYEKGARWSPVRISAGMALLELLKHSIPVQRTPARVMSTLAAMLQGTTLWNSPRGEADVLAGILLDWLSANPAPQRAFHDEPQSA